MDRFRDFPRSRMAILSINATPRLLLVLPLAFQFCSACALNPALYLSPAAVALRYHRACIVLRKNRAPAIKKSALSLSSKYGGGLSAARGSRAAASYRHEAAARAAHERLAREAH